MLFSKDDYGSDISIGIGIIRKISVKGFFLLIIENFLQDPSWFNLGKK